jgi:hypothetical protein
MSDKKSEGKPSRPVPSFLNPKFMESSDARPIRITSEYIEPYTRFRRLNVKNTIVFFGSARTRSLEDAQARLRVAKSKLDSGGTGAEFAEEYESAKRMEHMAHYYRASVDLSRRLTEWSVATRRPSERFFICSGGGPGIMEAANRGAAEAGGRSIGLNIALPYEQMPNEYQSPELAFEFHYFFMRKFWFAYLAKALVIFPGGFGTMDEMFELLTIVQTEKTTKYMPIILFGSEYWKEIVNFEALVRWGTIDSDDLSLFRFCDTVDEAFSYLQSELSRMYPPTSKKG